uniref:Uncharacterized protein n=1 Tax=viral metagenome TaxID=1070528 RepID=A0A6M3JUX5_9ZZZZ
MGSGLIISETAPELLNRYTWCKPLPNGSKEWYEPNDGGWVKVRTDPIPLAQTDIDTAIAVHTSLPNAHHPANAGITGSRTVGNFRLTFQNGLLTGFDPIAKEE